MISESELHVFRFPIQKNCDLSAMLMASTKQHNPFYLFIFFFSRNKWKLWKNGNLWDRPKHRDPKIKRKYCGHLYCLNVPYFPQTQPTLFLFSSFFLWMDKVVDAFLKPVLCYANANWQRMIRFQIILV